MKKNLLIFLTLVFFSPFVVNAEGLKMEWQKSWGGNDADTFSEIFQTPDGGFVAFGYSESTDIEGLPNKGGADAIIVKYDQEGNMLWQKSWGGDSWDEFYDILPTTDGGFVASGYSESTDIEGLLNKGYEDAIIVKYDKDGNMLWKKSWGGNRDDYFYEILQTTDGGLVAVGYSYSTDIEGLPNKGGKDAIIVKYDKDGNMLWQKSWGGNSVDYFENILQTTDGGFVAYGYSESTDIEGLPNKGEEDAIIVKYDKDGNVLWQKSWGGNYWDQFTNILQTIDGGFVAVSSSESDDIEGLPNKGGSDAIIVKYDQDGNVLWQKSWGGNLVDYFENILQTTDGGFVAYGYSYSTDIEGLPNKGSDDEIIVKYDKDGNLLWQKSWGGNKGDSFDNILQTTDGGFVAVGSSYSTDIDGLPNKGYRDAIIVKYSINYDIKTSESENGTYTLTQQGSKGIITVNPNEGYEVDQIIIKDKNGEVLDLEVTKLEDGTYSFDLFTDVSVEVTFKEKIDNPKTGILDIMTILIIGFIMSVTGIFAVKNYNERYEI